MNLLKRSKQMGGKTLLISIHPCFAEKIIDGKKRYEFRRKWAVRPVDTLVIYSTSPVKRIVAIASVQKIISGTPANLWDIAKKSGGGISQRQLLSYFKGRKSGFAVKLDNIKVVSDGVDPTSIFGKGFRPPQSFRYLRNEELARVMKLLWRPTL